MNIKDPRQAAEAANLVGRVQLAVEHVVPKGAQYIIVLQTPSFGTVCSSLDTRTQLQVLQGLVSELQTRALMG